MVNNGSEDNKKLGAILNPYNDEEMIKFLKKKRALSKRIRYYQPPNDRNRTKRSLSEKDKGIRGREYKIAKWKSKVATWKKWLDQSVKSY